MSQKLNALHTSIESSREAVEFNEAYEKAKRLTTKAKTARDKALQLLKNNPNGRDWVESHDQACELHEKATGQLKKMLLMLAKFKADRTSDTMLQPYISKAQEIEAGLNAVMPPLMKIFTEKSTKVQP